MSERHGLSFIIDQHVEEMEKEIEKEFEEILRNNTISPYNEDVILFGKNFAFKYIGLTRFKYVIHLKFEVFRRHEAEHQHENYDHTIGKVVVAVKVG